MSLHFDPIPLLGVAACFRPNSDDLLDIKPLCCFCRHIIVTAGLIAEGGI